MALSTTGQPSLAGCTSRSARAGRRWTESSTPYAPRAIEDGTPSSRKLDWPRRTTDRWAGSAVLWSTRCPFSPRNCRPSGGKKARMGESDRATRSHPVRLAQLALEELARGVARELVDEVDRARFLVARETFAAERDERIRPDMHPASQLDHGLDRLTPPVVRDADHRRVHHCGMSVQDGLDL